MSNVSIQLGSVELRDFEIPPYIIYGGNYRLAVHRLASGRRAVEKLGPDEADIRFIGAFSGPDAAYRARAIDNMRLAGSPVWLTWSSFRYRVIVTSFVFHYKNPQWVEYQAKCAVVRMLSPASAAATSASAQASSDLASAGTALPGYQTAFKPLGSAIAAADAFTTGTAAARTATVSATAAAGALSSYIQSCGVTVQSIDPAGSQGFGGAQLVSAANAAGQLASAVVSLNYIKRIQCALNDCGS